MARQYRKPRGRPITWYKKVTAPPLALALYQAIAAAQQSDAFIPCHIYHGAAAQNGEPLIKFEGEVTGLSTVIASYMGIDTGRQQCATPGCCNPFHYINTGLTQRAAPSTPNLGSALADWVDLVLYHVEENVIKTSDISFDKMRPLIEVDDLSDIQLTAAIKYLKES